MAGLGSNNRRDGGSEDVAACERSDGGEVAAEVSWECEESDLQYIEAR